MSNQNDDSSNQRQRFNSSNNNNNNNNYTNNPRFQQRPNTYRNKHQSTEPEYNSYRNNNNKSYQKQRNSQQDNLKNKQESQPIVKNNEQQSSRLISVCSTTSSSTTSINCICCLHELETYAYYLCQHFVCLKCAIKMRILCQKIDCPVCRQESKSVLCTKKPIELSTDNNNKTNLINELILNCPNYSRPIKLNPIPNCAALTSSSSSEQQQYQDSLINTPNCGINFESDEIKEEYNQILSSKCDECGEWFREFDALDNHMRKKHRYFYCELCLENLKLFPYERKYYNREELAMHKRNGDKSGEFKGHPLCHYCDNRFYDRDELYRHYRKEHYFCHFCDSDGHEEYYKDYSELRNHFLQSHYLCEMDKCSYNAAETHEYVVFRNELDLQAHKKQIHAKNKSDLKNYGKINIEFNVRPNNNNTNTNSNSNNRSNNYNNQRKNKVNQSGGAAAAAAVVVASESQSSSTSDNEEITTHASNKNIIKEDEFPVVFKLSARADDNNQPTEPIVTNNETNSEQPTTTTTTTTTLWRNMISQGNAPKINQETEFPSLASTIDPITSASLPTLADLGFKSASNNFNVTSSKKQTKKELKKATKLVEPQQPTLQAVALAGPPPGFNQIVKPPPTTTTTTTAGPPPGFEKTSASSNNQTNNSSSVSYIKPDNYDARNESLSLKLKHLFGIFDETEYESFRSLSIDFRQNKLNSKMYLSKCQHLLDGPLTSEQYINKENLETLNSHLKFLDLIQEMIILLPDVVKQQELFDSFNHYIETIKQKQKKSKNENNKNWSKQQQQQSFFQMQLVKCQYCNQYLINNELSNHQIKYHNKTIATTTVATSIFNNNEYPSLGATSKPPPPPPPSIQSSAINKNNILLKEELFPPLNANPPAESSLPHDQTRYSSMPTPSLFANPSSHLSLVNKKKHRLQK